MQVEFIVWYDFFFILLMYFYVKAKLATIALMKLENFAGGCIGSWLFDNFV